MAVLKREAGTAIFLKWKTIFITASSREDIRNSDFVNNKVNGNIQINFCAHFYDPFQRGSLQWGDCVSCGKMI